MARSRYENVVRIAGGKQFGTSQGHVNIRRAAESGSLKFREHVIQESERLDILAGKTLGDARLWWVIAAASGIGWCLQVPPGTRLMIPTDLAQVMRLI